jgi:phosphatidate cytidylyltransferase
LNNLIVRSITGSIFAVFIAGSLLLNEYTFLVVFGVLILLGMWEFYSLMRIDEAEPQRYFGTLAGLVLFIMNYLYNRELMDVKWFLVFILFLSVIYFTEMVRNKKAPFRNIAVTLFGIIYIALPFSLFSYLVIPEPGGNYTWHFALAFFVILWTYDTGAYLTGIAFGKKPLWKRISPKKTWEGAIGGGIIAMALGAVLPYFCPELTRIQWIVSALIIVFTGTIGDLFESVLKRSLDIKDSGKILPGHGGLLDRFDSTLLAAPLFFLWLQLIK